MNFNWAPGTVSGPWGLQCWGDRLSRFFGFPESPSRSHLWHAKVSQQADYKLFKVEVYT